jgi:aminopeptidase N
LKFREIFFFLAFKVWHQRSKSGQASLALDYGSKILTFFENFFGMKYPFPKIAFVAIPNYSSYSTENWGVMFFSEDVLLVDERFATAEFKENLVKVPSTYITINCVQISFERGERL